MKTRLKDIAEHLNLSSALVSGVLNQRENVWASVETRARVFQAARDLNYRDFAATLDEPKREEPLDLLLLGGWRTGSAALVGALARERTISLVAPSSAAEAFRWAAARSARPLVVCGPRALFTPLAKDLAGPFVRIAEAPGEGEVGFDLASMAAGAVDHLRALGHRRISYLGERPVSFREGFLAWTRTVFGEEGPVVGATEAAIEAALGAPRAPSGWVVGGEPGEWELLEACLARRGQRLGFGSGGPAASGLRAGGPLALGAALAFDTDAGAVLLAQTALAVLQGEDIARTVRLRLTRALGGGA